MAKRSNQCSDACFNSFLYLLKNTNQSFKALYTWLVQVTFDVLLSGFLSLSLLLPFSQPWPGVATERGWAYQCLDGCHLHHPISKNRNTLQLTFP